MLTAVNYNRAQLGLDGFNGTYLTPGMFKEMVKRTFNLQVGSDHVTCITSWVSCERVDTGLILHFPLHPFTVYTERVRCGCSSV